MRRAGLSRSRLNHAKSLYAPFFRWAKSRRIITRNPMADFQLPTSQYVSKQRTPPEVEELSLLLAEAVLVVPDVAPLLVLGAVTGMRRGELVGSGDPGSSGAREGSRSTWLSTTSGWAAECREAAATRNLQLSFDGSILALRKFTSSELLDAGFNISMVAQRQGHGPQVLIQHYSKSRRSADRRAAEHLG